MLKRLYQDQRKQCHILMNPVLFAYREVPQETKTGRRSNQLVVPKGLRQQVMSMNHESAFSGHLGAKKTEVRILLNFFWPGLRQDVIGFCSSFDVCQRTVKKENVKKVPLGSMPLIDMPFKRVAVDIVGSRTLIHLNSSRLCH